MTTLFLVRHGSHGRLGSVLCGRMAGVSLGADGMAQAQRLGERFACEDVACVISSPLERALQTAEPIARSRNLPLSIDEDLNELDCGAWAGKAFDDLRGDPEWMRWNTNRLQSRPPGGESYLECQTRVVRAVERACAAWPDQGVALVFHADCIKTVLAHFLGLPLDFHARFEIGPASVSVVAVGDWGAKVMSMNEAIAA